MQQCIDVLGRYSDLLAEVDSWFEKCSLVAGEEVACGRGCSCCCRGLFDITLLDACFLRQGIDLLPFSVRNDVVEKSLRRISSLNSIWPDFGCPFILNIYPEKEYDIAMPDDDETPCPLLDEYGNCLAYAYRPMTCRLHGIPVIDFDGEPFFDEWCSKNFNGKNPLEINYIRFNFKGVFTQEQLLFREFTARMFGESFNELDTIIPAAALIEFSNLILPEMLWNKNYS